MNNLEFLEDKEGLLFIEFLNKIIKKSTSWFLINGIYFPKNIMDNTSFFE